MAAKSSLSNASMANPTTFLLPVLILSTSLIGLNTLSPWFSPILFVICAGGMVLVARTIIRVERAAKIGARSVDYEKLAQTDIDRVVPWLKENLRGQDSTIDAVCSLLKKSIQLARPGRTLGNYLLVGPTGTGKTFFGQLVGKALFPESEVILLGLNQFKHPDDARALVGASPGHDCGGHLTEPALENPYRVIILTDIEKAHREVHDCLYEILDTGSCREKAFGRLVDFSATVFFATCEVGVDKLRGVLQELGGSMNTGWLGRSRDALADAAKLDRAFLSRWDGIFLVDTLSPLAVAEVACLQLASYWQEYGIDVGCVAPELIAEIVERNQEFAEYGVRQVGRIVRDKTEHTILDARRAGLKRVNLLTSGPSGELEIEVPA